MYENRLGKRQDDTPPSGRLGGTRSGSLFPGMFTAFCAVGVAWIINYFLPQIPLLTAAVGLGILFANIGASPAIDKLLAPGLSMAAKRLMRIGIVLLGLKLSLMDIAGLGWQTALIIVAIVILSFIAIFSLGRLFKLPGDQPLLVAAGFSICGASAIGAFAAVTKDSNRDATIPVALVTLFGTLAIFILPLLRVPLDLDTVSFGQWVGASVHDVGQVVATAQIAGPAALSIAIVVKLTRVLMLAPMVAITGIVLRRIESRQLAGLKNADIPVLDTEKTSSSKPSVPIVPLFLAGFLIAILVRTSGILSDSWLSVADTIQTVLLGAALFALGSGVKFRSLVQTGGKAFIVGIIGWAIIAALAWAGIHVIDIW